MKRFDLLKIFITEIEQLCLKKISGQLVISVHKDCSNVEIDWLMINDHAMLSNTYKHNGLLSEQSLHSWALYYIILLCQDYRLSRYTKYV